MKWLVSGGTGLIGTALIKHLLQNGHAVTVLTRRPSADRRDGVKEIYWDGRTAAGWQAWVEWADVLVHLAGENIGAGRWSAARKAAFLRSRVESGAAVVDAIRAAAHRPNVLVQASAVGYYGDCGARDVTEDTPPGTDFLSRLAVEWEDATRPVEALGVRRVIVRTGVVLAPGAEVLAKLQLPFRLWVGGPLGSGNQAIPWIHIADTVGAICFLVENETARGAYNLASLHPLTNAEFGKVLAQVLRRPYWLPVPAFALRLALGEMSQLVLEGQRALPGRLQAAGYRFIFTTAREALQDLLNPSSEAEARS